MGHLQRRSVRNGHLGRPQSACTLGFPAMRFNYLHYSWLHSYELPAVRSCVNIGTQDRRVKVSLNGFVSRSKVHERIAPADQVPSCCKRLRQQICAISRMHPRYIPHSRCDRRKSTAAFSSPSERSIKPLTEQIQVSRRVNRPPGKRPRLGKDAYPKTDIAGDATVTSRSSPYTPT
jgi:hypothetical protein